MFRWRTVLLVSALLPAVAAAGIAVSPVKIEKTVSPEDRSFAFVVANPSEHAVEISISTAPLIHDRQGRPIEPKKPYRFDASKLLHFNVRAFTLPARRWRRIHAQVDIPHRPGGGYAFIYVRSIDADAGSRGVDAALRVGVVVELRFPDPGKTALRIEGLSAKKGQLSVAIRNTGEIHVQPAGKVVLRDAKGHVAWSAPLISGNIFPGLVRDLKIQGAPSGLAAGTYDARVRVTSPASDAFSARVAVRDGAFTVKAAPTPVLSTR